MTLRLHTILTGLLALITAALLALAPASANPTSGGYQLFERVASGISTDIQLASLENFDYYAKTASECCIAPNGGLPDISISRADQISVQVTPPGQGTVVTINGQQVYVTKNLNGEISSVGPLNTEVGTAINPFSTSPSDPKNWREWLARGLGDGARLSDDFDVDLD